MFRSSEFVRHCIVELVVSPSSSGSKIGVLLRASAIMLLLPGVHLTVKLYRTCFSLIRSSLALSMLCICLVKTPSSGLWSVCTSKFGNPLT